MKFPAFEAIDFSNKIDDFSIVELLLTHIEPDPNQPRKNFQQSTLEELALSIKLYGVIQPIFVRKTETDKYQIIAGERRWRASHIAGLKFIPAIIQTRETHDDIAISLIENIQREELNPIELAQAFFQLNTKYKLSHEAIGIMVGKSRAHVTNLCRLLNLHNDVRNFLIKGKLEMGHARCLLTLPQKDQSEFALRIIKNDLSVRDTERLVQLHKHPKENRTFSYSNEVQRWTKKLNDLLSTKVKINLNEKGKGRILIQISSPKEIEELINQLSDN